MSWPLFVLQVSFASERWQGLGRVYSPRVAPLTAYRSPRLSIFQCTKDAIMSTSTTLQAVAHCTQRDLAVFIVFRNNLLTLTMLAATCHQSSSRSCWQRAASQAHSQLSLRRVRCRAAAQQATGAPPKVSGQGLLSATNDICSCCPCQMSQPLGSSPIGIYYGTSTPFGAKSCMHAAHLACCGLAVSCRTPLLKRPFTMTALLTSCSSSCSRRRWQTS